MSSKPDDFHFCIIVIIISLYTGLYF